MAFPPCEVACLAPFPMFQFHLLIARPPYVAQGGRDTNKLAMQPEKATVGVAPSTLCGSVGAVGRTA